MGTTRATARRRHGAGLLAATAAMILATTGTAATAAPTVAAADDFSMTVSPAAIELEVGKRVSVLVSTATTSGAAQSLTLAATHLPDNVVASFAVPSIISGGSVTLTFSAATGAATGTYQIPVVAIGNGVSHSATLTLTVTPVAPCSAGTNATDVPVSDLTTMESPVAYSACPGNASATSTVEVHIVHPFRGDLVVSLVAPDGSAYMLHTRQGGGADNVDEIYTVDLSSEARNGTWRLQVLDAAPSDTGYVDSWTLNLDEPVSICTGTNDTDAAIIDRATVESPITLAGCTGNASTTSTVEVHIVHSYRGDLVVSLVAPDGSAYVLHTREGYDADNIDQIYTVDLSSEPRNGAWRLRVLDALVFDTGYINSWTLTT